MRSISLFAFAALIASTAIAFPLASARAVTTTEESLVVTEDAFAMNSAPVTDVTLSESRGAFSPIDPLNINASYLNANSSGNVNIGGVTGNNQIGSGSFSNAQGLVNVIQNSGNNVVIQSSTIVNMTMIGQ